ncbi:AfsR/SARP family transcriptional regulator [Georgenia alba]|uniref:BTAD domain-containing putative transcriptional regulator n=1 Tax=Georgenia alba TaxID=2233858 RepID=A0ABW2Q5U9_9MICO
MTSELWVGLLGELHVRRGSEPVPIGRKKLRVLLATLALDAGRTVSYDRLVDTLWGQNSPSSARSAIHVYANRLRSLLDDDGPTFQLILTQPNGYRLAIDRSQVDVTRFSDAVLRSRAAGATGDLERESELLATALSLWQGAALADVPSESLQNTVVPRLHEEHLQALERRLEVDIQLGRHAELLGELAELTHQHPEREQLRALHMRALQRAGRRAEALEVYQDLWSHLRDELGIEPGPAIRRLHADILAGTVDDAATVRPTSDRLTVPSELPPDTRHLVGREPHVATLVRRLTDGEAPLTIVSGPPGAGKTALAVHAAHRAAHAFPDGQLYVNLGGYSAGGPLAPEVVLGRFLRALGVATSQIPVEVADQVALYRTLLAGRRVLVVLDNAADPEQVRPLLPGQSQCAALVTSRDALRGLVALDGGDEIRLATLGREESYEVLAGMIGADRLAAEPDAAAALVETCAGLPLALRIAAANVQANTSASLADHVDAMRQHGRLARLRVPGDTHAAVRTTFDLSYERLETPHARLFRLLGLVPGPDFTATAAAALSGRSVAETEQQLDHLQAASLVGRCGAGRFHLHDLIREYAASRTDGDGEALAAETGLWDHYLRTARDAADVLYPDVRRLPLPDPPSSTEGRFDEAAALAWLDAEMPNLVAAVQRAQERGRTRYAWLLADALGGYFWERGHAAEGLRACTTALAAARAEGDRGAEARMLNVMGLIHFSLSRFEDAGSCHRRALELSRSGGDKAEQLSSLFHLGRVIGQLGPAERSVQCHAEALELARELGELDAQVLNTNYIGVAQLSAGRADLALEHHRRALALNQGNDSIRARVLGAIGNALLYRGELGAAIEHYEQCLELARRLGNRGLEANGLVCLAETHCEAGDYEAAVAIASAALRLGKDLGEPRHEVGASEILTTARFRNGQTTGVVRDYRDALARAHDIGFRFGEVSIRTALAAAHRQLGDPAAALAEAEHALQTMDEFGIGGIEARTLVEAGRAQLALGDVRRAMSQLDRALALARRSGLKLEEGRAHEVLGLLAGSAGDRPAAEQHWETALAIFTTARAPDASRVRKHLANGAQRPSATR